MHSHLKASHRKYYWSKIMYARPHTHTGINLTTKVNIQSKNNKSTEKNDNIQIMSSLLNHLYMLPKKKLNHITFK